MQLNDDGSYACMPDPLFRGQIRLIWKNGALNWQTYNRKTNQVESTTPITNNHGTLSKVDTNVVVRENTTSSNSSTDRIYVYTKGAGQYEMYWMQQLEYEKEEAMLETWNGYLKDPDSAKPSSEVLESAAAAAAAAGSSSGSGGCLLYTSPSPRD